MDRQLTTRLQVLLLLIALPRTCRSRWPADQLTFAYTRSRPDRPDVGMRMAHAFTVRDGKIAGFREYTDTAAMASAFGGG